MRDRRHPSAKTRSSPDKQTQRVARERKRLAGKRDEMLGVVYEMYGRCNEVVLRVQDDVRTLVDLHRETTELLYILRSLPSERPPEPEPTPAAGRPTHDSGPRLPRLLPFREVAQRRDGQGRDSQQDAIRAEIAHGELRTALAQLQATRRRLAATLGMPVRAFTRRYCAKTDGQFHLRDEGPDCLFLKNRGCTVYEGRPTQCRTWPFWPENMGARAWSAVAAYCPGVGKGRHVPRSEIEATLAFQRRSTAQL